MLCINYDVTLKEIETAYNAFWRKYGIRKTILMTAVYAVGLALFINLIIKDGSNMPAWAGAAIAAGMLFAMWLRPARARKKLIAALEQMYEEKYTAWFDDEKIEIETVIMDGAEDGEKTDKTSINIATEELYAAERREMFVLFVNRALIYAFPKRCLTDEQLDGLRKYFEDKGI
ncbi:MAG: hypothetical protein LBI38_04580 [Oscillospiraceae bacterium]|jgi:hypothetical protein|nr:hypothetical protein [Oscillospiraceae bacterium]